jgi:putative phosphoesterase
VKLGILSDIHVDLNTEGEDGITPAICRTVERQNIDCLITAGDVADDFRRSVAFIQTVRERTGRRCLFVPGNHDIWTEHHPEMSSWQIYEALQEVPGNLSSGLQPLADDWIAIGDLGWYDYSFGGAEYSIEEFDRMQFGERVWQDGVKAVWNRRTREVHEFFYSKLKKQLEEHREKRIVLVIHVLPIADFTVRRPSEEWNYLNAFLGSREYGDLVLQHPNVKYCITGHVHYRKTKRIGDTEFVCNCLGYTDQWKHGSDPAVEVAAAMLTVEI